MKTILKKEQVALYIFENNIQDLDKINFLKSNLEKELNIKNIDDINMTITVQEYENSKWYTFPASLFFNHENETEKKEEGSEEEEIIESQKFSFLDFLKKINSEKIIIWIFGLFSILFLLFSSYNKNLTADVSIISPVIMNEFDILTNKNSENLLLISQELQEQKKLRDLVNVSIEKVKKLEEENNNIRKTLLNKAQ